MLKMNKFKRANETKSERFKRCLKCFYDYLKIQHNNDDENENENSSNKGKSLTKKNKSIQQQQQQHHSLPELIVDSRLVDNEQIYQQLQLYNNDSIHSMTKFFAKCLLNVEQISFNIDMKKAISKSKKSQNNPGSLINTDNSNTNFDTNDEIRDESEREDDDEEENGDDDDDDGGLDSDDSLDDLIKSKLKLNLKKKMNGDMQKTQGDENKKDEVYGIPDGSDSEISDFDVDVGEGGDDDDDAEEDGDEEDDWVIIFL